MLKVRVGRNPHDGLAQRDLNRCRSFGHARRHCGRLWLRDRHGQQHGSSRRRAPVLQAHPVAQQVRVDAVAHRQAGDRHARHTGMFHQPSLECRGVDPFAIAHSALDHRAAPLRDVSRVLHMDTHARRSGLCHQWGGEATLTIEGHTKFALPTDGADIDGPHATASPPSCEASRGYFLTS